VKASLSLLSEPTELRRMIGFAEGFARRHALPGAERARLLIILEELFTNVVKHGYGSGAPPGNIEVALTFDGERLRIEFSDDGRPFDPLSVALPNIDQPAVKRQIGGLGLRFLRSLANDAQYSRYGDRNRLVLTRKILRPG
jgi:anti-sigma regulatory factor (Ser/Thr protein kinase)